MMTKNSNVVEKLTWYDTFEGLNLPHREIIVALSEDHPFMEHRAVKDLYQRTSENGNTVLVVAKSREGRASLKFHFYEMDKEGCLFFELGFRGQLEKFRFVAEYTKEEVDKLSRSRKVAEEFGV